MTSQGDSQASIWPDEFDQIIRQHCRFVDPAEPIHPEVSLIALGLSSLGLLTLIIAIEDSFGIVIPDEILTSDTLKTPGSIWTEVRALMADQQTSNLPIESSLRLD
jgi:acyl carrier protein